MSFAMYVLLDEEAPIISTESLALELEHYLRNEECFSLEFDQLPFSADKALLLRWDSWRVRVSYETGEEVVEDSKEIARIVGKAATNGLAAIDKRIRLVFGDDDAQEYTNQIIYLLDFMREIPGATIFDPQQADLLT